jgi:DNA-binding HxlR family transcriptional regulator
MNRAFTPGDRPQRQVAAAHDGYGDDRTSGTDHRAQQRREQVGRWRALAALIRMVKGRWDIYVIMILGTGSMRVGELLRAINKEVGDGPQLAWPVLSVTLTRLEKSGLVTRERLTDGVPAVTRVGLTLQAKELTAVFTGLHAWWMARQATWSRLQEPVSRCQTQDIAAPPFRTET